MKCYLLYMLSFIIFPFWNISHKYSTSYLIYIIIIMAANFYYLSLEKTTTTKSSSSNSNLCEHLLYVLTNVRNFIKSN